MTHPALQFKPMSLNDFGDLLADQPDGERWELIDGRVVRMMVGTRWEHARIIGNLHYELRRRFAESGSPCRVFTETFRLEIEAMRASLLPDLMIVCRPLPPGATSLADPTVVVEVMSEGTARRDRDDKWAAYRTISSLRHYVLVSRDTPHVEIFDRVGDAWRPSGALEGLDAVLDLSEVDASISLRSLYADVLA